MNLNLASFRKVPSQEVRDPNSPGIKVWTSMVSQPATGNRLWGPPTKVQRWILKRGNKAILKPQTLGNTGEETNLQTQPAAGNSLRGEKSIPSEAEARMPKYADLRFRVLGESLQWTKRKGDYCRRCTTSVDRRVQDQHIDLGECLCRHHWRPRLHMGPNYTHNLEIYKNTNFEELQNLFDITQKLVTYKQLKIQNVKTIECTCCFMGDLRLLMIKRSSGQRQEHEFIQIPSGENVRACVVKMSTNRFLQIITWNWCEKLVEFEWNIFPGLASLDIFQKIQKHLQKQDIEPENFEDRIIFMSMFNDIEWTRRGNSECISNSEQVKNYATKFRRGTGHSLDVEIPKEIRASSIPNCCSVGSWNSEDEEQQGDHTFHCGCFKHRAFMSERFTEQTNTVSTEQSQAGV